MRLKPTLMFVAATAAVSVLLAVPQFTDSRSDTTNARSTEANGKTDISIVLYEGPLIHDQNWVIKAGRPGPDNQKPGGTCSLIPTDVNNVFARERITFEARWEGFGLWSMAWIDLVSGSASDGNLYVYRQRAAFSGPTNDGKPPRPNRSMPSADNPGVMQTVPDNVNTGGWDLNDLFMLHAPGGGLVANSHIHWVTRLQLFPGEKPPDFFPFVLLGKYILNTHEQLSGEQGCDPL